MKQTLPKGILSAAAVLAVAMAMASPASAHGRRDRECVSPTGHDDTQRLQSALERCAGARHKCVVRLCEGVFRTAPLRVGHFRGTLKGAGSDRTVIKALPDVAVNPNPLGYWRDNPLDPGADPWPHLLQFIEGRGTIRDLAVEVPAPGPGSRPTTGWTGFSGVNYEMASALLITGRKPVSFQLKDLRIVGGGEGLELSLLSGISVRGLIFNPADTSDFPVYPLRGRVSLKQNALSRMLAGISLGELDHARVLVARNELRGFIAVDVVDASRSRVRVLRNHWDTEYVGVQVTLNVDGEPSVDNLFFVAANRGTVGSFFGAAAGIYFQDPLILTEPGDSALGIIGNHLTVGQPDEPAFVGIEANGAGFLKVWQNDIDGGATAGIRANQTEGCLVALNDLENFEANGGFDLELGLDASECLAVVGPGDTFVDQGTDNRVFQLW